MPEKTKQVEAEDKEQKSADDCEEKTDDNWSKDQREKSYYYDDSYGYEIYKPDEDDEDE